MLSNTIVQGLDAARHFARLKVSHLILACRDLHKANEARTDVLSSCAGEETKISCWQVDMASYASVQSFADRCNSLDRIDAILINAGIQMSTFEMAEVDETQVTVNVVSALLLAVLTVPSLKVNGAKHGIKPTIAITGTITHAFAVTSQLTKPANGEILRDLSGEQAKKKYGLMDRYNITKLLVLLGARELAAHITATDNADNSPSVVVNFVAPGWCKTRIGFANGSRPAKVGLKLIGRTSEEGSRTLVHAVAGDIDTHGQYLSECQVKAPSAWVTSEEGKQVQKRVWAELVDKFEAIKPGCTAWLEQRSSHQWS